MDKKILTHRFAKGIRPIFIAALAVGLALGLAPVMVANAATFDVTTTVDGVPGSLRQAIIAANANPGPDTINLPAGIYTLTIAGADEDAAATGDLDITDDLTIIGADQATTIIDGGTLDRVFHIHPDSTVEISGVTIRNGDVPVIDPSDSGGGISNDGGTVALTNSTVTGNVAAWGGGINNFDGTLTLTNCTVSENRAQRGGGILNFDGTLTLTDSTVRDNTAWNGDGGGISSGSGGGPAEFSEVTITNSIVSGNMATAYFGDGGGIASSDTLTITDSIVTGNTAGRLGGGIVNSGTLTLANSTVSDNTASSDAGGIRTGDGTAQIMNSTISGNSAGGYAGGIQNFGGATLTNVTISGNSANSSGGGIGNWLATITLTNVTVSDNTAGANGGGIFVSSGVVSLKNTIVANNTSGGDCSGSITSAGCNLDTDGTCGFGGLGDLSNTDPLLGPLQDNGGPTETHALLPGSPAIDAVSEDCGCTVTEDQRGAPRPIDGDHDGTALCDIGAYEKQLPVGGIVEPVDMVELGTSSDQSPGGTPTHMSAALWLGLAFILAIGGGVLALRRRRAH